MAYKAVTLAFTATQLAFDGKLNSLVAVRALDAAADAMSTLASMRLPGGELRARVLVAHRATSEAYDWLLTAGAPALALNHWRVAVYAWELAEQLTSEAGQ
jgi:hypothetical protein